MGSGEAYFGDRSCGRRDFPVSLTRSRQSRTAKCKQLEIDLADRYHKNKKDQTLQDEKVFPNSALPLAMQ